MLRGTVMVTVKEESYGYRIKCKPCGYHYIPKIGKPGASWSFNKNFEKPTFTPSVNESQTYENKVIKRCHYVLTDGIMHYCSDCMHELAGRSVALEPYTEEELNRPE